MRSFRLQPIFGLFARPCTTTTSPALTLGLNAAQARWNHAIEPDQLTKHPKLLKVPPTTPFVPDVETFLTLIGRGLRQHASKFPTWDALFTLSSEELKELGIEPPRTRRYLLRWRQRFREGRFGPGGDLKYVYKGKAKLGVVEKIKSPIITKRTVVNIPHTKTIKNTPPKDLFRPKGYKVKGVSIITGPYALPSKGGAVVKVTEGMWEDKRGHKVDGGERRRAEVRFKRGVAERKALRERGIAY